MLHACLEGETVVVSQMLAAGADPNHPGWKGNTLLHFAARHGRAAVSMLLAAGAAGLARNEDGEMLAFNDVDESMEEAVRSALSTAGG